MPDVCSEFHSHLDSSAFSLWRWQGLEKQAEMNWFASSEQPAIKRFYWSSQFSPTWLSTNEHTAPFLRGKNGVERFPSLRTQWSGFQLCEKGKRKLQPLVTSNKMLSSSFPFRNASEAEIYSGNHLLFQLLISMLIQKKICVGAEQPEPHQPSKGTATAPAARHWTSQSSLFTPEVFPTVCLA